MKKGSIIAGVLGAAALAALVPFSVKKDEEKDELAIKALLWKYKNVPDPDEEGSRLISLEFFCDPFKNDECGCCRGEEGECEDTAELIIDCAGEAVEEVAEAAEGAAEEISEAAEEVIEEVTE